MGVRRIRSPGERTDVELQLPFAYSTYEQIIQRDRVFDEMLRYECHNKVDNLKGDEKQRERV